MNGTKRAVFSAAGPGRLSANGHCGKVSGRDEDKIKECGFNVKTTENGSFIDEAEIAITCKKLYFGDILKI
jgi:hypothetical protein